MLCFRVTSHAVKVAANTPGSRGQHIGTSLDVSQQVHNIVDGAPFIMRTYRRHPRSGSITPTISNTADMCAVADSGQNNISFCPHGTYKQSRIMSCTGQVGDWRLQIGDIERWFPCCIMVCCAFECEINLMQSFNSSVGHGWQALSIAEETQCSNTAHQHHRDPSIGETQTVPQTQMHPTLPVASRWLPKSALSVVKMNHDTVPQIK